MKDLGKSGKGNPATLASRIVAQWKPKNTRCPTKLKDAAPAAALADDIKTKPVTKPVVGGAGPEGVGQRKRKTRGEQAAAAAAAAAAALSSAPDPHPPAAKKGATGGGEVRTTATATATATHPRKQRKKGATGETAQKTAATACGGAELSLIHI